MPQYLLRSGEVLYRVNPDDGSLHQVGGQVQYPRNLVFACLVHLIKNRHRIVPAQELLDRVWPPDINIQHEGVTRVISSLRDLLGDTDHEKRRFIRTAPKRGYKFIGDVEELNREMAIAFPHDLLSLEGASQVTDAARGPVVYASSINPVERIRIPRALLHRADLDDFDRLARTRLITNLLCEKLRRDLALSHLTTPSTLMTDRETISDELSPIEPRPGPLSHSRWLLDPSYLDEDTWNGYVSRDAARAVREINDRIGRPLRINCSSINAAACAVLLDLAARMRIDLDMSPASGQEQALALQSEATADLVIAADAPIVLAEDRSLLEYARVLEVCSEDSYICRVRGEREQGYIPQLFIYERSSSFQHFLLARSGRLRFPLPPYREQMLLGLEDFLDLLDKAKRLRAGDMIVAWGPLAEVIANDRRFELPEGGQFQFCKSIYIHPDWFGRRAEWLAFINIFVAAWNRLLRYNAAREVALGKLGEDATIRGSIERGSAIGAYRFGPSARMADEGHPRDGGGSSSAAHLSPGQSSESPEELD